MPNNDHWRLALAVWCPRCHAAPQEKCRSLETTNPKRWPHPPRIQAYKATLDQEAIA